MNITTIALQSLFDISLQGSGSVEGVFAIAIDNDINITGELEAGSSVVINNPEDKRIADYYRVRNIKPATYSGRNVLNLTGIGYMIVEDNFIIG
jgi:hypothetical protein